MHSSPSCFSPGVVTKPGPRDKLIIELFKNDHWKKKAGSIVFVHVNTFSHDDVFFSKAAVHKYCHQSAFIKQNKPFVLYFSLKFVWHSVTGRPWQVKHRPKNTMLRKMQNMKRSLTLWGVKSCVRAPRSRSFTGNTINSLMLTVISTNFVSVSQ